MRVHPWFGGLLVLALAFSACSDKKDGTKTSNPLGPSVSLGGMQATMSGAFSLNFSTSTAIGWTVNADTAREMSVWGSMNSGGVLYEITITVPKTPAAGTYTLGDAINSPDGFGLVTVTLSETEADFYFTGTGSIRFDRVGTDLAGSFNFTAHVYDAETETILRTVSVTNGAFNVPVMMP
ncbi:hypothetical protein JW777_05460 [bacterium]|nr:hypothetical protein [bacterium]